MAAHSSEPTASKAEKKIKKDKKRAREEDAAADGDRKHKKSKSVSAIVADPELKAEKKKKKKSKKEAEAGEDGNTADGPVEKKKHKKKHHDADADDASALIDGEKKKKKKSKKSKDVDETEADNEEPAVATTATAADSDAMDVDFVVPPIPSKASKSKIHQPPDIPANPQFPFFTQTVSLYEPLFPIGWAQPVTSCQYQHLEHLQNKYVPNLRGVLLDYRNVAFGEQPGRKGAAMDDESPTNVMSKDESAVGFGWITADVDLFVPSRGAWMEGSVNLQTEGHIGVVCFGKFNASIEARRVPPSWKWVPNEAPEAQGFEETASVITADDHGVVRQIHSTGFWVDGDGEKVKGKIRFRIRNFDVGMSGETSYLSLEGTMLDKAGEKTVIAEEAAMAKMRKNRKGGQKRHRRHIPDFAMTRFAAEEEQAQDTEEVKREVLAVDENRAEEVTLDS